MMDTNKSTQEQQQHNRPARKPPFSSVLLLATALLVLQLGAKGGCEPQDTDSDPAPTTTTSNPATTTTNAGSKSTVNATTLYVRWRPEGRAMGYFEQGDEVVVHQSSPMAGYLCVTGKNKYGQEFTGWVATQYVNVAFMDGQPCDAPPLGFPLAWYRCMQHGRSDSTAHVVDLS
jgi:hypothetical protein